MERDTVQHGDWRDDGLVVGGWVAYTRVVSIWLLARFLVFVRDACDVVDSEILVRDHDGLQVAPRLLYWPREVVRYVGWIRLGVRYLLGGCYMASCRVVVDVVRTGDR